METEQKPKRARRPRGPRPPRKAPISVADLQERAKRIETESRIIKATTVRLPIGVYEAMVEVMEQRRVRQHEVLVRAIALGLERLRAGEPMDDLAPREYRPWSGYDREPSPEERMRVGRPAPLEEALATVSPENPLFTLPGLNGRGALPRVRTAPQMPEALPESLDEEEIADA